MIRYFYLRTITSWKKACTTLGFFFIICSPAFSQSESISDSLEMVYTEGRFEEQDRLPILKKLSYDHPDPDKALKYSEELIKTATALDSIDYLFNGLLNKGNALTKKGDLSNALDSYFEGAKIAIDKNKKADLGIVNVTIADVYSIMENHDKATEYYRTAIDILRSENDSISLASALLNAGDEYFSQGKLDTAILFFQESGLIFKEINYLLGTAYNLGNTGMVYAEQGKDDLALEDINEAIMILEDLNEYQPISVYLTYMSDIYLKRGDWNRALSYSALSLELSQRYGLKKQISDAYLQLSILHEQAGNLEEYIENYKNHISYKDSVSNISTIQEVASIRADFEISQKQMEVDLLNEQKKNQRIVVIAISGALLLLALLIFGLYRRYRFINRTKNIIEHEKNRSERLLLNILPEETAHELKENGKVEAKKFESVTILFTDFKNFTTYAEKLSPEELVKTLDYYFSNFDAIIEKYGLEKIKTIGDAYMCVAGLPFTTEDHAIKMVNAGLELAQFVEAAKKNITGTSFDIRIGLNSGPVVAGVVGTKKFAYDIWGDAVNIASRMESKSEPGKVNVSENTFALIKDTFDCEYRGEIEVKHGKMLKMYFVND
jgi:class 3 adenylate cyclase